LGVPKGQGRSPKQFSKTLYKLSDPKKSNPSKKVRLKRYKKLKPLIRLVSPFIRMMLEKQSPYKDS